MIPLQRRLFALFLGGTALAGTLARAAAPAGGNKAVFQVTEVDPGKWTMVLNNVHNLQTELADDPPEVEVVVYGPAIAMLKADSPVGSRVAEALKSGARVVACQNSMKGFRLTAADMLPGIGYVPAGVVEVMRRQQQGWAYIRP